MASHPEGPASGWRSAAGLLLLQFIDGESTALLSGVVRASRRSPRLVFLLPHALALFLLSVVIAVAPLSTFAVVERFYPHGVFGLDGALGVEGNVWSTVVAGLLSAWIYLTKFLWGVPLRRSCGFYLPALIWPAVTPDGLVGLIGIVPFAVRTILLLLLALGWAAATATWPVIRNVFHLAMKSWDDEIRDYLDVVRYVYVRFLRYGLVLGALAIVVYAVTFLVRALGHLISWMFDLLIPDRLASGAGAVLHVVGIVILLGCLAAFAVPAVANHLGPVMTAIGAIRDEAGRNARAAGGSYPLVALRAVSIFGSQLIVRGARVLVRVLLDQLGRIAFVALILLGTSAYSWLKERITGPQDWSDWLAAAAEAISRAWAASPTVLVGLLAFTIVGLLFMLTWRPTVRTLRALNARLHIRLGGLPDTSSVRRIVEWVIPPNAKGAVAVLDEMRTLAKSAELTAEQRYDAIRERMGALTSRRAQDEAGQLLLHLHKERRQDHEAPL